LYGAVFSTRGFNPGIRAVSWSRVSPFAMAASMAAAACGIRSSRLVGGVGALVVQRQGRLCEGSESTWVRGRRRCAEGRKLVEPGISGN